MQKELKGLSHSATIVYLDDVMVLASSPRKMIERLKAVFDRFRESNLLMHRSKSHWSRERIKLLGHFFDRHSISTDPEKISILVLPRFDNPFILTTDASTTGLAYILSQRDENGREQVVSYDGRGVRPTESRWTITELEMLPVVEGTKHFHTYLAGNEFDFLRITSALLLFKT